MYMYILNTGHLIYAQYIKIYVCTLNVLDFAIHL